MSEPLDKALDALKTYDWGVDPNVLKPIDDAIIATHGDAAARKKLEAHLIAALKPAASRAAKDAACRALKTIGTAASVPALAAGNNAAAKTPYGKVLANATSKMAKEAATRGLQTCAGK